MKALKLSLLKNENGVVRATVTSADISPAMFDKHREAVRGTYYRDMYMAAFDKVRPFERIDLVINSGGGLALSAGGLEKAIEAQKVPVRLLITGQCASAATWLLMCTDDRAIVPGGSVLVHMPKKLRIEKEKGVYRLRWSVSNALTLSGLVGLYKHLTGRNKKQILAWMNEGKRFTAPEAVAEGFVRRIVPRYEWEKLG